MVPTLLCLTLGIAAISTALAAPGPGKSNDFDGKRVLIFGIDGLRSDGLLKAKAPVIKELAKTGTATMTGIAGGNLEDETKQPTISGPSWTTILTGTYTNKHGLVGNATNPYNQQPIPTGGSYQVDAAPHFAKYLREAVPEASISSIVSWDWLEDYLVAAQAEHFDVHTKAKGSNYKENDLDVVRQAIELLRNTDPDVLFLHIDQIDGAGHSTGFTPENEIYINAIQEVDTQVGEIIAAVEKRPKFEEENWLFIVVTDHGGYKTSHGGQTPEERTIPIIIAGNDSSKRGITDETPGYHVIPATIFQFLGILVKDEWGWEKGTFGLP